MDPPLRLFGCNSRWLGLVPWRNIPLRCGFISFLKKRRTERTPWSRLVFLDGCQRSRRSGATRLGDGGARRRPGCGASSAGYRRRELGCSQIRGRRTQRRRKTSGSRMEQTTSASTEGAVQRRLLGGSNSGEECGCCWCPFMVVGSASALPPLGRWVVLCSASAPRGQSHLLQLGGDAWSCRGGSVGW